MDLLIQHKPFEEMSDEEFYRLCTENRDLHFERNVGGNIILPVPAPGDLNSEIHCQLRKGKCFGFNQSISGENVLPEFELDLPELLLP
ncbi:MAG TPA: hypothetical protein VFW11_04545 [Cyclobacteriaceae bacterium]|nr:hypothetical protein [Cyclobacteriaceae bacterium]